MFDVGFLELMLIGVVALLVIGPQRLPKVARTAGMWFGRARRFVSSVKQDIEQELHAEEIKKAFDENKISNPLKEAVEETRQSFSEIKKETEDAAGEVAKAAASIRSEDKKQPGDDSSR